MRVLTTTLRGLWWKLCLVLLVACGGPLQRVDLQQDQGGRATSEVQPAVLLAKVTGRLGTVELARCHRTLREAEARNCTHVIFLLQDAGSFTEDPDEVQSLLDRLQASPVLTVAVLGGRVTGGAAAIALCTKRTLCLPSAQWGELMKPEKEIADYFTSSADDAVAQRIEALRTAMGMRLDRREPKLRPEAVKLALAMADPRVQLVEATVRQGGVERTQLLEQSELVALQGSGAKVFGDRPLVKPLYVSAAEAEQYGLSFGTLQQLDQLADVLTIDRATIGELSGNWAEGMVGWLEMLQPFLLVVGMLLLLIEIKTPGVGLPGLLGVAFLGLAMFYSYLVGLAEVTEILVFFLGLAAIAVEIFVLPGMVVFGAVGFLCLVLSLILSRQSFVLPGNAIEEGILLHNLTNLTLMFVLVIVLGAVLWRLLPKVPYFNRVLLPAPAPGGGSGGTASGLGLGDARLTALQGQVGTAVTVLRPTGAMEIAGERYDVVTEGEFVEAGTTVRVVQVQGTRVVVAAVRAGETGNVGVVLLLLVLGLALLVAEVVFVSFGVIGTIAGATLISAVFMAFQESMAFGVGTLIVEAIAAPVVLAMSFRMLPKTKLGKQLILEAPNNANASAPPPPEVAALLHKTGVALTPLRPSGTVRIDGHKVDVVTRGDLIDAGATVVVLEVSGNRVVVGRR